MAETLIPMTKDGETIFVHELAVENHKQLGWRVSEEAPPKVEPSKPAPKKAETPVDK